MSIATYVLSARGVRATLDLALGQLADFTVTDGGRAIAPFHRVPWADEALPDVEMPPHLRRMSMDFFCAPFGPNDIDGAPYHGWPGNSAWSLIEEARLPDGHRARFQLDKTVLGATLTKTLTLRDGHPFLYQAHAFAGGEGALPLGHHAMVHFPGEGLLSFSDKRRAETGTTPLEGDPRRGRSILRYPADGAPHAFPRQDGTNADLLHYPLDERHDDLVVLVENPANALGWSAAVRPAERDLALVLKSPRALPVTILWYSNGGRFYPPWSSRHVGVLGIEEACASFADGHRASIGPNALNERGTPTSVALDGGLEVRSVIGAVAVADAPSRVLALEQDGGNLVITMASGQRRVPFDGSWLDPSGDGRHAEDRGG